MITQVVWPLQTTHRALGILLPVPTLTMMQHLVLLMQDQPQEQIRMQVG